MPTPSSTGAAAEREGASVNLDPNDDDFRKAVLGAVADLSEGVWKVEVRVCGSCGRLDFYDRRLADACNYREEHR